MFLIHEVICGLIFSIKCRKYLTCYFFIFILLSLFSFGTWIPHILNHSELSQVHWCSIQYSGIVVWDGLAGNGAGHQTCQIWVWSLGPTGWEKPNSWELSSDLHMYAMCPPPPMDINTRGGHKKSNLSLGDGCILTQILELCYKTQWPENRL